MSNKRLSIFTILLILSLLIAACGDEATPNAAPASSTSVPAVVTTVAVTTQMRGVAAIGCLPALSSTDTLVQACVSNATPKQDTDVTVYGRLIISGQAISGAKMETTWNYKFLPSSCKGEADSISGVASCTKNIGNATKDFTVNIDVKFTYQSKTYSGITSFVTAGSGEVVNANPPATPTAKPPTFAEVLQDISEVRLKSEEAVRQLKSDYQGKCIADKDYREAQKNYSDARAAFNSWITEVTGGLQTGKSPDKSVKSYSDALDSAVGKGNAFIEQIDTLYNSTPVQNCSTQVVSVTSTPVPNATQAPITSSTIKVSKAQLALSGAKFIFKKLFLPLSLVSAGLAIYDEYQKVSAEKKAQIIKQLEGEKWKSFEEL